jgi:hypothetical protein
MVDQPLDLMQRFSVIIVGHYGNFVTFELLRQVEVRNTRRASLGALTIPKRQGTLNSRRGFALAHHSFCNEPVITSCFAGR